MKRPYTKPDILFDSFSMSESIASCEVEANFQKGSCGVTMTESIVLFSNSVTVCSWPVEDGQFDGLCYHVPFESHNVFGS